MIPKIIHYCWFGGSPLPKDVQKCIESWRKYCPDFEIIEWNEKNFDYTQYRFSNEAYKVKEWAFVSDVARLHAVYEYGGIYLDTDVEVIKSLDNLLHLSGFVGAEDMYDINTGVGFGAEKGHKIIRENLLEYKDMPFLLNGFSLRTTCVELTTAILRRHGYKKADKVQVIEGISIFPSEFFSPLSLSTHRLKVTENTYSIHYYTANWKRDSKNTFSELIERKNILLKKKIRRIIDFYFGEGTYRRIKIRLKFLKKRKE